MATKTTVTEVVNIRPVEMRELRAFADKYSTLSELDTVIEAINYAIGDE